MAFENIMARWIWNQGHLNYNLISHTLFPELEFPAPPFLNMCPTFFGTIENSLHDIWTGSKLTNSSVATIIFYDKQFEND